MQTMNLKFRGIRLFANAPQKIVGWLAIPTIFMFASQHVSAQRVTIRVINETSWPRNELVSVDVKTIKHELAYMPTDTFVVKNAFGQQMAYQVTHDGLLLIEAAVRPMGSAQYIVEKGIPEPVKKQVHGALYPTRKDDIAWENDRGAYRVYGPALQKSGEKSFGIDVWVKNTPDLVVDNRYRIDYNGNILKDVYAKKGWKEAQFQEHLHTSFHLNHGDGLDCYSVGPSLGCGTPAILQNNQLVFPYCYQSYDILDNGPLRFTLALTFPPTVIAGVGKVVEHRVISLDKGSNFNKMVVWYEGLEKPVDMASGVVIHTADTQSVAIGKEYVLYADPTDTPDKHNFQIFVGTLFPNGAQTQLLSNAQTNSGIAAHAVGVVRNLKNAQPYTYYFGSAWSMADVRSFDEWKLRSTAYLHALKHPLKVVLQ